MSAVTLRDLSSKIDCENQQLAGNAVSTVVALRSLAEVEEIEPGALVVLDADFNVDARSYRFDLALRSLPPKTPAVLVPADTWQPPSLTAARLAANRGIALGQLRPGEDAVSLAMYVQSLLGYEGQASVGSVDAVTIEVEQCSDISLIPDLLDACSHHLGTQLRLVERPASPDALALRCAGLIRNYLEAEGAQSSLVKSATAQIARRVEALYEADYEIRALPDITRSELFNEILLSDPASGADAVNRLRRSEFAIDGSHFAVRVDCHDPLPAGSALQAIARCQARIAEIFVEALSNQPGQLTQAGTANSILLISTLERAHSDLVGAAFARALTIAINQSAEQYSGLRLHVGIGTAHLGSVGFRSSVSEASTALRAARARGNTNAVEQFDRLGLGRALVRWAEIDGVRPVINQVMGPILKQSPRQKKDTLDTLRAYLDAGQNVAKAAEALHLHRNTVRYRLDRITSLLSVDLNDPDDRLLLELSCRVVEAELL